MRALRSNPFLEKRLGRAALACPISQTLQLLRIDPARSDGPADRLGTVAIASACHGQIQLLRTLFQLPAARRPAAGEIDLNAAKSEAPKLHQFSSRHRRCRVGQRLEPSRST